MLYVRYAADEVLHVHTPNTIHYNSVQDFPSKVRTLCLYFKEMPYFLIGDKLRNGIYLLQLKVKHEYCYLCKTIDKIRAVCASLEEYLCKEYGAVLKVNSY